MLWYGPWLRLGSANRTIERITCAQSSCICLHVSMSKWVLVILDTRLPNSGFHSMHVVLSRFITTRSVAHPFWLHSVPPMTLGIKKAANTIGQSLRSKWKEVPEIEDTKGDKEICEQRLITDDVDGARTLANLQIQSQLLMLACSRLRMMNPFAVSGTHRKTRTSSHSGGVRPRFSTSARRSNSASKGARATSEPTQKGRAAPACRPSARMYVDVAGTRVTHAQSRALCRRNCGTRRHCRHHSRHDRCHRRVLRLPTPARSHHVCYNGVRRGARGHRNVCRCCWDLQVGHLSVNGGRLRGTAGH